MKENTQTTKTFMMTTFKVGDIVFRKHDTKETRYIIDSINLKTESATLSLLNGEGIRKRVYLEFLILISSKQYFDYENFYDENT